MKKSTLLLVTCLSFIKTVSFSQAGSLDSAFGKDGKVVTTVPIGEAEGYSAAIQADRKIVVAGYVDNGINADFALVRYKATGNLDNNFGYHGKVNTDFGGDDVAYSIAIQADGKILVAGYADDGSIQGFALARYKPNGALDSSFGKNGKVITAFAGYAQAGYVTFQSDGKIVVSGYCYNGPYEDFALARYKPNGRLDSSFGINGKVVSDFNGSDDVAGHVAILPNGKIVVTGIAGNGYDWNFALARYRSNGKPDSSFGVNGRVTNDFGEYEAGGSISIQADGKIVVGGNSFTELGSDFCLLRYNANGTLDSSFGNDHLGIVYGRSSFENAMAVQADGKFVLAGTSGFEGDGNFALERYNPDGTLDTTFGLNGDVTTNFGPFHVSTANSVVIQPNGKIVAAGTMYPGYMDSTFSGFALARYNGDNTSNRYDHDFSNLKTHDNIPFYIYISPNPVKDILRIDGLSTSSGGSSSFKTLSIMDVNGKLLQQTVTANSSYSFNIKQLSAGIYFIRVDERESTTTLKFIKE